MACYRPVSAWQLETGEIKFVERGKVKRSLELPCGQCIGCRLERSRQWAVRCMHESQLHESNSFITLTYADANLPATGSLDYKDFQSFARRVRKKYGKFRFYMCGEYGETFRRPHYHACIFGLGFPDRVLWKEVEGIRLYVSPTLTKLWGLGFATIGDVTFQSAAYIARYVCKKVTGYAAQFHYVTVDAETGEFNEIEPEFARMSLKPGIGAKWYEKFKREVFPHDRVVINGVSAKPPRYYDKLLEKEDGLIFDEIQYSRFVKSLRLLEDSSSSRLAVRETVRTAANKNLRRKL